jgi:hypothetical protein
VEPDHVDAELRELAGEVVDGRGVHPGHVRAAIDGPKTDGFPGAEDEAVAVGADVAVLAGHLLVE